MRTPPLFSVLAALVASAVVAGLVVIGVLPVFAGLVSYLEDLERVLP